MVGVLSGSGEVVPRRAARRSMILPRVRENDEEKARKQAGGAVSLRAAGGWLPRRSGVRTPPRHGLCAGAPMLAFRGGMCHSPPS